MKKLFLLIYLFASISFVSAQTANVIFDQVTKANKVLTFRVRLQATGGTINLGDSDFRITYSNTNTVDALGASRIGNGSATTTNMSAVTLRPGIQADATAINYQGAGPTSVADFNDLVPAIADGATITIGTFSVPFTTTTSGTLSCTGATVFSYNSTTFALVAVPTTCTATITLPLDLLSFTATINNKTEQPSTLLSWLTAQEVNTAGFDIERGADGKSFEKVGHVKSAGTSNGTYEFTDILPLSGVNYYRLKMMNTDGSFTHSPVRSVTFGKTQTSTFAVVPNPAKERVSVQLNADAAKTVTVMLVDVTGRVLFSQVKKMEAGFNEFPLNVANYPQGLYFVKVVDAKTTEMHRLVLAN